MNSKYFVLLLCIMMVSLVSALEWDNSLRYEEDGMKVTLENVWGIPIFGSDLGSVELKSHKSVDEILNVGFGKQVTMYYDFYNWKDLYMNGLGRVYFTDLKTGEEVYRNYTFVYWANETKFRPIYEFGECYFEKGNSTPQCPLELKGQEIYYQEGWKPYNSIDIPKEKIRIGIEVDVLENDYIDGVWTIAGEKISKHAEWNSSLETGLVTYLKLDNDDLTDFTGLNNGTNSASTNVSGKIGSARSVDSSKYVYLADDDSLDFGTGDFSVNFWYNTSASGNAILGKQNPGPPYDGWHLIVAGGGAVNVYVANSGSALFAGSTVINDGGWHMITLRRDSNNVSLWIDNVYDGSAISSVDLTDTYQLKLGESSIWTGQVGVIDEFSVYNRSLSAAEIDHYYNGGDGVTPTTTCTTSYVNESWSSWQDTSSCLINDTKTQNRSLNSYDSNACEANITYWDFQAIACNYCSYSVVNSSWSSWSNMTECLVNDTIAQNRSLTEYDENYDSCYAVTGIGSDLWNAGVNETYFEFQEIGCDYCTPNMVNSSWTSWANDTACLESNITMQSRTLTQYDDNFCGEESNTTFYSYQNISCSYNPFLALIYMDVPLFLGITYSEPPISIYDGYLEFDGVNDKIETSFSETIGVTDGFSISVWVKNNDSSCAEGETFFSKGWDYRLWVNSVCNIRFTCSNSSDVEQVTYTPSSYNLDHDNWTNILLVYNSSSNNTFYYINGVNVQNGTLNGIDVQTYNYSIGGTTSVSGTYFSGNIDEVRFYNSSLSESDVSNIYNSGRLPNSSLVSDDLIIWYSFDEGTGQTVYDKSGEGNHGV